MSEMIERVELQQDRCFTAEPGRKETKQYFGSELLLCRGAIKKKSSDIELKEKVLR